MFENASLQGLQGMKQGADGFDRVSDMTSHIDKRHKPPLGTDCVFKDKWVNDVILGTLC